MAEIVNLRQARKQKVRVEKERQAAQNRVTFGRSNVERETAAKEAVRVAKVFESHKRDDPSER